jgi:hypothetical protein
MGEVRAMSRKKPEDSATRSRDLMSLLRNPGGGAQANNMGWPLFNGKYITYPRFKKEWWFRGLTGTPTIPMEGASLSVEI